MCVCLDSSALLDQLFSLFFFPTRRGGFIGAWVSLIFKLQRIRLWTCSNSENPILGVSRPDPSNKSSDMIGNWILEKREKGILLQINYDSWICVIIWRWRWRKLRERENCGSWPVTNCWNESKCNCHDGHVNIEQTRPTREVLVWNERKLQFNTLNTLNTLNTFNTRYILYILHVCGCVSFSSLFSLFPLFDSVWAVYTSSG